MAEASSRWRLPVTLFGGVLALIGGLVLAFGARDGGATAPTAATETSSSATATAGAPSATPATVRPRIFAPTAGPSAPHAGATVAALTAWPTPPTLADQRDPVESDPFESRARRPQDVRELVRVGDVRLGVTYDSKVRDEKAVVEVLRELGAELDQKERGRTDSFERRAVDYQPMLLKYGARLAPLMDGAFAFKGAGWSEMLPAVADGAALPEGYRAPH